MSTLKRSSVPIAKDRLKVLLISDRVNCKPNTYDKLSRELYQTVSKYIEIPPQDFNVQITHSKIHITIRGEDS